MMNSHFRTSSLVIMVLTILSLYSSSTLTSVHGYPRLTIPSRGGGGRAVEDQQVDSEYVYDEDDNNNNLNKVADNMDSSITGGGGVGLLEVGRFLPSSTFRRGIGKRHTTCSVHHNVCERCAKHTKSHEVYSQCCQFDVERKWCNDFLAYEIGRK